MSEMTKLELVPVTAPSPAPAAPAAPPAPKPKRAPRKPASPTASESEQERPIEPPPPTPSPSGRALWREWSSFDRTSSFRLPPELLSELDERVWKLRLSSGVTVAAALALLLDQSDERLVELVERAEEAKPRRRGQRPGR